MHEKREQRESRGAKHPVLAAAAYLIVPGERRRRASGHFRKAGFEALRGLGALVRPDGPAEGSPEAERRKRKSINIE
ncbi:Hypothetical Protein RradSPS_1290 [Rubrobacter radiotolerans]|uniref:Uncharacterized protein n=1 Tax=Rubrobacter radiotolerans TaxID=42256 RepID=A0A023X2N7_RUBRA|nr:hypothetical protein [Rubrobacter radiotolerans]AHY46573.1 Hypothetical Protein RradSPS_1290 [Rubrobacter radiotolerans]MDX5893980.1 hypothetical protein [Rubrobacter radiotolerans]SMC04902.1 conserved hypothetical protein [Rubrobacter radiotolerans DSM 5868]